MKSKYETIRAEYFTWCLYRRAGVYYADGRGNAQNVGRYSLGTRDQGEALKQLHALDRAKAIDFGLRKPAAVEPAQATPMSLETGRRLYEEYLSRPEVAGGPSKRTLARYGAVLDKFLEFMTGSGKSTWNEVDDRMLSAYLRHLETKKRAARTLYFEGTLIKSIMRWFTNKGLLPATISLKTKLRRPSGTTTHCWKPEEVRAIVEHCDAEPRYHWLRDIAVALARTGLRIGELLALRPDDIIISEDRKCVVITNDPESATSGKDRRRTKNRQDRYLPIHPDLLPILEKRIRDNPRHVFQGPQGGRLKPDDVRVAFVRDVINPLKHRFPTPPGKKGFEHGRLHSFRHYFASQVANANKPPLMLQRWLGHLDSSIVDIYYHLSDRESQRHMTELTFADEVAGSVARGAPAA